MFLKLQSIASHSHLLAPFIFRFIAMIFNDANASTIHKAASKICIRISFLGFCDLINEVWVTVRIINWFKNAIWLMNFDRQLQQMRCCCCYRFIENFESYVWWVIDLLCHRNPFSWILSRLKWIYYMMNTLSICRNDHGFVCV